MTDIMTIAKQRAEKFDVKNVLVATNSGTSVRRAYETFGPQYKIFAVGNPASAYERGLVLHSGISEETQRSLEQKGIKVILQDQSIFQKPGLSFMGVSLQEVICNVSPNGRFNAISITYNVLQLFSDGPRVCLEIALMAADSGELPLDADCVSIASPSSYCDLPDAAVILRPAKSENIFKGELRIKDVVLCPTSNDVWFTNGPLP